ncbi:PREDICTED: trans-resveratrol di-O-methyltransferase-like [Nicotiana attenuata]|uniref:Myricetin 7/4'-O-methyltransferase 2 n=1 Tax=Nicotiana attenuata TaxID=49451 RepID=A0A1J6IE61_NICAT|nr:PREDICTED: trans-resveratrol di-O-methyltransferase-like [Nicotiana attenuata]OIT02684.1 trans-resveratrol di-o-methyltransferase [Nicotiana attenuata]
MAKKENNRADHEQLLQAEAQTWDCILSFVRPYCITCAVELGIPDILHKNGIMTISDLVASLPNLNPSKISFLPILMRILVHSGLLHYQKEVDGYSVTSAGSLLVENEPFSKRSNFLFSQNPIALKPFFSLSHWLQDDLPTAFDTTYGKSMWDYCAEEPKFGHIFNDAMASDSKLISHLLINSEQCKHVFEGLTSLVDVGGGTGTVAMAIANAFPRLNCIVLDLPHVIGDRKGITTGNLEFVAGSMFDSIPYANAILLKFILHNWSDEDCVKLLRKCRESIPSKEKGGKVIVIDIVMEDYSSNNINEQLVQVQHLMDVVMRITHGAKERTKTEWEKLFLDAGFSEYKITANLGFRSLIEIYP